MDVSELVTALYRHLLGREADAEGLADKSARLLSGAATIEAMVKEFVDSDEYLSRHHRRPLQGQSQFGELGLLLGRMCGLALEAKIVVDVGARGKERSNSFDLLESFSWRGVLIEANPRLIPKIAQDFAGLDVVLVECAVSDYEGQADFHIGINDDVSSLNHVYAHAWGETLDTIRVAVRRLGPILTQYGIPFDFGVLSIDLEGEDVKVFNDLILSTAYRPMWVIIEASNNFQTRSLVEIGVDPSVASHYDIVGQTTANLILELRADRRIPAQEKV